MAAPTPDPPPTMAAWQFSSTAGGMEQNLHLNPAAPTPTLRPDEHLVQVQAVGLNPVDYKLPEIPLLGRLAAPLPAVPGIDFAGRLITPAKDSPLQPGAPVFGMASYRGHHPGGGALAQYALVQRGHLAPLPPGVAPTDAVALGVAGMTALQSLAPHVPRPGARVFLNGGSGGVGSLAVQVAKQLGCTVTTTCSTPNVALCRDLGADVVIDYKNQDVLEALKAEAAAHGAFDLVVDNVGHDAGLYFAAHEYTSPAAPFVAVAGEPGLGTAVLAAQMLLLPGFLGGGRRKLQFFWAKPDVADFERLAGWMAEGTLRAQIDCRIPWETAPHGYERLKTGRARGKVVVDVAQPARSKN